MDGALTYRNYAEVGRAILPAAYFARLGLACTAALAALWSIASFWFPFGWDQGFFASTGDVILRGGMPYRDAWEIKGPLAQYGFALAEWLFGRHTWSIRILDLPLLLAGAVALGVIVARVASPARGRWTAIAFVLWVGSLTWFHTIQPDTWAAIFIVFAALPLVERKPSIRNLIFSGLAVGAAGLVKPLYLAFLALPISRTFEEAFSARSPRLRERWIGAAFATTAALIPAILAAGWFAKRGALTDLVDVHLLYTLRVYSAGASFRPEAVAKGVVRFFLSGAIPWALPVIATGVYALWRGARSSFVVILVWLVVAIGLVAVQAKFYKYHWALAFPPLLALGAAGFEWALRLFPANTGMRRLTWGVTLALALAAVGKLTLVPAAGISEWMKLMAGRISEEQYYASHRAGEFVAADEMKAAEYIRNRTGPDEGVAVYGSDAEINFLSGRGNPTRFLYSLPLTEGGQNSPRAAYRHEYMDGLLRRSPSYFVVGVQWGSLSKAAALDGFPELEDLLQREYSLETRIGALDLYRRIDLQYGPDHKKS